MYSTQRQAAMQQSGHGKQTPANACGEMPRRAFVEACWVLGVPNQNRIQSNSYVVYILLRVLLKKISCAEQPAKLEAESCVSGSTDADEDYLDPQSM